MKHRGHEVTFWAWLKGAVVRLLQRLRGRSAPVDADPAERVGPVVWVTNDLCNWGGPLPTGEPVEFTAPELTVEALREALAPELVDQPEPAPEPQPPLGDVLEALGFVEGVERYAKRVETQTQFVDQPQGLGVGRGWRKYRHRETGEVVGVEGPIADTMRIRKNGEVLFGKPGDYLVRPAHGGRRFLTAEQLDTYWMPVE